MVVLGGSAVPYERVTPVSWARHKVQLDVDGHYIRSGVPALQGYLAHKQLHPLLGHRWALAVGLL